MNSKFKMSIEDNIFYAKRNIVDSIYKEASLEGIAVTFPETEEIYEGRTVPNLTVNDIVKINNLKHAWQFVFDTVNYPCDLQYVKQVNYYIQAGTDDKTPGMIRNYPVRMGGTSWCPEMPHEETAKEALAEMLGIENPTDRAVSTMLYLMRAQLFGDGNKRTAQIVANQIMIQNGQGILSIPVEKNIEFKDKLVKFYETADDTEIKQFVYEHAIDGFTRETESINLRTARINNGVYNGKIISVNDNNIIQSWEDNGTVHSFMEHRMENIVAGKELLQKGNVVTINYTNGSGTVLPLKKETEKDIER